MVMDQERERDSPLDRYLVKFSVMCRENIVIVEPFFNKNVKKKQEYD